MTNQINIPDAAIPDLNSSNVIRRIRWYEKSGDRLIGETTLNTISLTELQTWFGAPADDPLYDCYPVSMPQASHLQQKLEEQLDLDQYSYYLECDAVAESKLSPLANRANF